jgi:phage portal protein BeeE
VTSMYRRLRPRSGARDITSLEDYVAAIAAAGVWGQRIPGVTETMGGQAAEPPPVGFDQMARTMFGTSSVVFACLLARFSVFSSARVCYQGFRRGQPSTLFGSPDLAVFEQPWVGGTTPDLLARMITDADLAGNGYITNRWGGPDNLVRMRPDWVDIVLIPRVVSDPDVGFEQTLGYRKAGYAYYEDGRRDGTPVVLLPDEVAHFAPIPDPWASYRGMSWLTPVIREQQSDSAMTEHKTRFMRNAATPNMVIKHAPTTTAAQAQAFKDLLDREYGGPENAGKTLHLGGGADLTVVGKDMKEMDLRGVQGATETRIAAAAGVPPIIAGFSEGLQAATYSNYAMARRRFADGTLHPLWANMAGSLQQIHTPPAGARLWYDVRAVPFLREDSKDAAEIVAKDAQTIRTLVDGGFTPESSVAAVTAQDMTLLVHTGLLSVQLQEPGANTPGPPAADPSGRSAARLEIARA